MLPSLTANSHTRKSQLVRTLLPAARPRTHQTFINQMAKAVALVVDEMRRKEPLVVIILTRNLRRVPLLAFCSFHVIKKRRRVFDLLLLWMRNAAARPSALWCPKVSLVCVERLERGKEPGLSCDRNLARERSLHLRVAPSLSSHQRLFVCFLFVCFVRACVRVDSIWQPKTFGSKLVISLMTAVQCCF